MCLLFMVEKKSLFVDSSTVSFIEHPIMVFNKKIPTFILDDCFEQREIQEQHDYNIFVLHDIMFTCILFLFLLRAYHLSHVGASTHHTTYYILPKTTLWCAGF